MTLHCYVCQKSFGYLQTMFWHLKRVHAIYPYNDVPCGQSDCPKVCSSFRNLKIHLLKHHKDLCVAGLDSAGSSSSHCKTNVVQTDETSVNDVDCDQVNDVLTDQINMQESMQGSFMAFIAKLQARSNVLLTNAKFVTENVQELLHDSTQFTVQRIRCVFSELGIDESVACVQNLYQDLEAMSSAIDKVDTEHKQIAYLKRQHLYIEPQSIPVGVRKESRKSVSSGSREMKDIVDTAQYIPIELLLARIIIECKNNSLSLNCNTHASKDGNLTDYFDTNTYKNHPFFSKFPDALVLHLYIDGFETTNPLGPHIQIHKMEGLYMIVRNLPSKLLSKESSIFLVGMWYAQDAKDKARTYDIILAPLVNTLMQLESDDGIDVSVCDQIIKVRAALAIFSADNLGYHSLFGFLESFNSRKFCRFCEATKEENQINFYETDYIKRTKESYNESVNLIDQPGYKESDTGIKHGCIFNKLKYFHVMENFAVDAMHDLLEGIIPIELCDILGSLSADGYISLNEFNLLLTEFNFGSSDINSRPTTFSSLTHLKMTASECWCLIRNLPFIIGHKVPRDEPHWNLLLLLMEIVDIVLAPRINAGLASYLSHLIAEHHQTYLALFPDKHLTPKHHFLVHYPTALIRCGPPCRYWCMRFESRHNYFKQVARGSHCFKNIAYSLTKRGQIALANAFLAHSVFSNRSVIGTTKEKFVSQLEPHDIGQFLCDKFLLSKTDTVHVAQWIEVGHYRIEKLNIVVCSFCDGLPEFGCVECIVYLDNNALMLVKKLTLNCYDNHFHGYMVEYNPHSKIFSMQICDLKDHIPLNIHSVFYEGKKLDFVSPRYVIF